MIENLIFFDNPISRFYIKLFLEKNYKLKKIIFLNKKHFLPKMLINRYEFTKQNHWPLVFLRDKKILKLTNQIEEFFSFKKDFIKEVFKYDNIYQFKKEKIIYADSLSINSKEVKGVLENFQNENFLISNKEIVKQDIINMPIDLIHIHPGFLPFIKGADSSLWGPFMRGKIGGSCFYVNEKIDNGEVIFRKEIDLPKFNLDYLKSKELDHIYKIWFSFVDPMLRCFILNLTISNFVKKKNSKEKFTKIQENGQYFSFMNKDDKEVIFRKIFR